MSFFLSLPSFGVFVEFLHPWKPGGVLRRGEMPANSRGACVAQETSSAFFFFWPVFSEFIPHAQTHTCITLARASTQTLVRPRHFLPEGGENQAPIHSLSLASTLERVGAEGDHKLHSHDEAYLLSTHTNTERGRNKQKRGARMASFLQPLPCSCIPGPAAVEGALTTSYTATKGTTETPP